MLASIFDFFRRI